MDANGQPTNPDPTQMTRDDHENRIKMMDNFLTALRAGTFPGHACEHVAVLIGVISQDRKGAIAAYEAAAATHPEWGAKHPKQPAGAHA